MARFMRTDLGLAHSRLEPPAVVGAGISFRGPGTRLTNPAYGSAQRRDVLSRLRPPVVVTAAAPPFVARPVAVTVASRRVISTISQRANRSELRPPVVVIPAPAFNGPGTALAYSRSGAPKSLLRKPVVVSAAAVVPVPAPIRVKITRGRAGHARPLLLPPSVVGAGIAFGGPGTVFAYQSRGRTRTNFLSAPAVVGAAAAPLAPPIRLSITRGRYGKAAPNLYGPAVVGAGIVFDGVRAVLAPSRRIPAKSTLRPPAVVAATQAPFAPLRVVLAPSPLPTAKSRLSDPAVVGAGIVFRRVEVTLAQPPPKRRNTSDLFAPKVVAAPVAPAVAKVHVALTRRLHDVATFGFVIPPSIIGVPVPFLPALEVRLAPSKRGKTRSFLSPPTVVGPFVSNVWWRGPGVRLVPPRDARASRPISRLRTPPVVGAGIVFAPIRVQLAPTTDIPQSRGPDSRLAPPTAVQAASVAFYGPSTHLVRGRAGHARPELLAPAVVGAGITFRPIRVELAPSTAIPRRPESRLYPPVVVQTAAAFYGPAAHLVRGRAGRARPELLAPAVIGAGVVFRPIRVQLAPSAAPQRLPNSRLSPPTVVQSASAAFYGPASHLARGRSGHARPELLAPSVVGAGVVFAPVAVTLAGSTDVPLRRRARPELSPPAVVQPVGVVFYGPSVHTTRGRAGKTRPELSPPAAVGAGVVFRPVEVTLARIKPVPVRAVLAKPTVVFQAVELTIRRTLVRSRPVPTTRALRPPTVVFTAVELTVRVALTASRPPAVRPVLHAPAVVGAGVAFRPILARLAPSTDVPLRRRTRTLLRPPAVVASPPAFLPYEIVQLAPQRRGIPKSDLRAPAVVGAGVVFRKLLVRLAPSTDVPVRRRSESVLRPPRVVAAPVIVRPLKVTLVRGRAGAVRSLLFDPVIPPLAPPVKVTLVRGRAGVARSLLFDPIIPPLAPPVTVTLARIRPVPTKALLFKPVFPPVAPPLKVTLARIRPARTSVELRPPTVVLRPFARPVQATFTRIRPVPVRSVVRPAVIPALAEPVRVTLTRGRAGAPLYRLHAPVSVRTAVELSGPLVRLAPQSRGKTRSRLKPPPVAFYPPFPPVRVRLARIRPVLTHARVAPPAAIGGGVVFRPVEVVLADIRRLALRPKLSTRLIPPTVTIIVTPGFTSGYDLPSWMTEGGEVSDGTSGGDEPGGFTSGDDQQSGAPLP